MKKVALLVAATSLTASAFAVTYTDSTSDIVGTFAGFDHLNIASMDVTNDATSISFTFNLVGSIQTTSWGKYCVFVDTASGGDTAGNGWGRPVGMAAGAERWLGSWVDGGGGFENRGYSGSWNLLGATYNSTPGMSQTISANSVTLKLNLSDLGASIGQTICFDGITTAGGGNDGAVDSLSNANPNIANWSDYSQVGCKTYTIVPEPATMAGLALGVAFLIRRKKK